MYWLFGILICLDAHFPTPGCGGEGLDLPQRKKQRLVLSSPLWCRTRSTDGNKPSFPWTWVTWSLLHQIARNTFQELERGSHGTSALPSGPVSIQTLCRYNFQITDSQLHINRNIIHKQTDIKVSSFIPPTGSGVVWERLDSQSGNQMLDHEV